MEFLIKEHIAERLSKILELVFVRNTVKLFNGATKPTLDEFKNEFVASQCDRTQKVLDERFSPLFQLYYVSKSDHGMCCVNEWGSFLI